MYFLVPVLVLFVSQLAGPVAAVCVSFGTLQDCGYNLTSYNTTVYPNPPATTIINAATFLPALATLAQTNCSRDLQKFVCASLFPNCEIMQGPCQGLCDKVYSECSQHLTSALQVQLEKFFLCNR